MRFTQFRSMESFHRYTVPEFYLRVLGNYVNPLCSVVGWNPFMLRFCSMHCVNLGILQWLNGCTLHTLFDDYDMFSNGYFVLSCTVFFPPFIYIYIYILLCYSDAHLMINYYDILHTMKTNPSTMWKPTISAIPYSTPSP